MREWHNAALPWCLAEEESYWEIFLSLERNNVPKGEQKVPKRCCCKTSAPCFGRRLEET